VQTVDREANALYFDLIAKFESLTGVPVVLNTSFPARRSLRLRQGFGGRVGGRLAQDLEDGDDGAVAQPRRGPRLVHEELHRRRARAVRAHPLDGHEALQVVVVGQVDRADAAAADATQQVIARAEGAGDVVPGGEARPRPGGPRYDFFRNSHTPMPFRRARSSPWRNSDRRLQGTSSRIQA